ncbi:MAG: phosphotransferase, partial [Pelagibacteraceae bacterium]
MSKLNILEKLKSDIFLIAGDASPRKFFRFRNNKKHILVYCEKDKRNNLENYIKINNFLIKKKIKVPKIIKKNIKKNFIIIEDFGNKLLKNQIENNRKKINFFKKIIDELIKLQNIKLSKILPKYSMILLTKELNLFYDWYLPEFFSKKKIRKIKRDINSILINYLKKTVKLNNVFVHRDFHIENLILHKSKIGFLDTQDAVIGHAAYDLMSLIDDVRINLNKNEQEKI